MTIIRNYLHLYVYAVYTSHSYYLRVVFILLRASNCAATIRGQRLFEGGVYLTKYNSIKTL